MLSIVVIALSAILTIPTANALEVMERRITGDTSEVTIRYDLAAAEMTAGFLDSFVDDVRTQKAMVTIELAIDGTMMGATDLGRWWVEHRGPADAIALMQRLIAARQAGASEWAGEFTTVGLEIAKGFMQAVSSGPIYDAIVSYVSTLDFDHTELQEGGFDLERALSAAKSLEAKAAFITAAVASDSPWINAECLRRELAVGPALIEHLLAPYRRRMDQGLLDPFSGADEVRDYLTKASRERASEFKQGLKAMWKEFEGARPWLAWAQSHCIEFLFHRSVIENISLRFLTLDDVRHLYDAFMYANTGGDIIAREDRPWHPRDRDGALYIGPDKRRGKAIAFHWKRGVPVGISWSTAVNAKVTYPYRALNAAPETYRLFDADGFRERLVKFKGVGSGNIAGL